MLLIMWSSINNRNVCWRCYAYLTEERVNNYCPHQIMYILVVITCQEDKKGKRNTNDFILICLGGISGDLFINFINHKHQTILY